MTGKEKCELLKTIRKNIAEMNGIEYDPEPCHHEGECPGFCPRCDADAAYLMRELKRKEAAGSPIRIDTESIGDFETLASEPVDDEEDVTLGDIPETPGIIVPPEDEEVMGNMICPEPPEIMTLKGDVALPSKDEKEAEDVDWEQALEDKKTEIDEMCRGCVRYESITSTEKGVRCACLSEHFFANMLEKKHCSLKK